MMRALVMAVVLAGCDDDTGRGADLTVADLAVVLDGSPPADGIALALSASARPSPDNVVSALVDVQTSGADSVVIDFGDDASYGRATPRLAAAPAMTIPIFGLTPAATTHLQVTAFGADGRFATSGDLTVQTGALPSEIPPFAVVSAEGSVSGALFMGLLQFVPPIAVAAIVERGGRLLWYRDLPPPSTSGLDFERTGDGRWLVYDRAGRVFDELDPIGRLLHSWRSPAPLGTDGHDVLAIPSTDRLALLGEEPHPADTRQWFYDAGVADGMTVDTTLDEVDRDGGVAFHWSSWPEITLDERDPDILSNDPTRPEVLHPNALSLAPDGNWLLSSQVTSTLYKLDRQSGAILWRLGGKRSDFTIVADPDGGFSHQHDARFLPDGHLLLVDNGNMHAPPHTRACEYLVDENARTATLVWVYRHSPDLFSPVAGSARRLSDGDTVIDFANNGVVVQVDAAGTRKWEMHVPGVVVYRALPVSSLY